MAVTIPNAQIEGITNEGELLVTVPKIFVPGIRVLLDRIRTKHNGYGKITVDVPFKPRTLKGSRKFHAVLQVLHPLIDMSFDDCKMFVKMEATALGYRTKTKSLGNRVQTLPISESEASTREENMLIETALKIGAEAGHDLEAEYQLKKDEA
jgi:hypothetical protein